LGLQRTGQLDGRVTLLQRWANLEIWNGCEPTDGKEIVPLKHLQANETARSLEGRFGLWPFSTERLARIIEPWRL
jgi:hypothetical protein